MNTTNDKAHNDKEYIAEVMYVHYGLPKEDIAAVLKVSVGTVRNWQGRYKWREQIEKNSQSRTFALTSSLEQIKSARQVIDNRNGIPSASEAELIQRLLNVCETMEAQTEAEKAAKAFRKVVAFFKGRDAAIATRIKQEEAEFYKYVFNS